MARTKPAADWRERALDMLQAPRGEAIVVSGIRLNPQQQALVNRAARARGMSPAAFMRRSSIAMACHDLGEDWERAMVGEPGFGAYGRPPGQRPYRPEGHGFGKWIITGLRKAFPGD